MRMFQTNLTRGYKPSPSVLSAPRNVRKYGRSRVICTGGKLKTRLHRMRKGIEVTKDGKKIPKEKASRSSFFTVVSSQEKVDSFLSQRGFSVHAESAEKYSVEIHTDHEFLVITDKAFNFLEIRLPKLRWCAVDVKRAWKENPEEHDMTDLDGVETDVRFVLQVLNK